MLGFAPLATIPPAGSPLQAATAHVVVADSGTIAIVSPGAAARATRALYAAGASLPITPGVTHVGRHRGAPLGNGAYALRVASARLYQSSYHLGDPETIRVPPEITAMQVTQEHRAMVAAPDTGTRVSEPHEADVEPRLRAV